MLQKGDRQDGLCLEGQKSSRHVKMLVLFYLLLDEKTGKSCSERWIIKCGFIAVHK